MRVRQRRCALVYGPDKVQREEKLVDGPDAAHADLQQREDIQRRSDEELPGAVEEAVQDASLPLRSQLLGAVRMILDRQNLDLSQVNLPTREVEGLVALQVAVEGKSNDLAKFVFASDRRDLLERALAVLQPDLTHVDSGTARELQAQFDDLVQRVGELREELTDLEDAQDELLETRQKAVLEAGTEDAGDKPKPKPSDPDAPRPATTLTGPDRPEPPRPNTTLTGPDRAEPPRPATTLTGPELAPKETPPSTLGGEAAEDAKKKPWWRRPFG